MNRYALFLGCTTPLYVMPYEVSARWVCNQLGIELVDIEDFICCGFNQIDLDRDAGLLLAAMNLAYSEARGLDILTLCTACAGALTAAAFELETEEKRDKANTALQMIDLEYSGSVKVKHISRVLCEDIGIDVLKEKVVKDLSNIRAAPHYGCHYLKPESVFEGFDDPDNPETLHQLISLTGANPVNYETSNLCCGGKTFPIQKDFSYSLVQTKLGNLKTRGIDCMVVQCPTCYLMYSKTQKEINKRYGTEYDVGVVHYPQLLGLALGGEPATDLALDLNGTQLDKLL
ncbi:MAG: CoB--CoM heterodisulfide reductase iron-sulfur subunit B family protein [Spirochaetes bacterium]|nr:CoB--CoM heterodisulfide reductase iron-sulfur subunit B family protein [Spirochaetota bacterium]